MKLVSEKESLGFFPGDRDYFLELYDAGKNLDILQYVIETYRNDRSGTVFVPDFLLKFTSELITVEDGRKILIAEAEKYLNGLHQFIEQYSNSEIFLTSMNWHMYKVLQTAFESFNNVRVLNISIYRKVQMQDRFDVIVAVPTFGGKLYEEETSEDFLTRETEGVAAENLLNYINETGRMYFIAPAKFTFTGGPMTDLRKLITDKYNVNTIFSLPEGIFRPYTGIKTYLICVSNKKADMVQVGSVDIDGETLKLAVQKHVPSHEFQKYEDWRIELFLTEDQDGLYKFVKSEVRKVKLKEIAEIFRGKAIMKDDVKPGEFFVLNISNLEDGEVLLDSMDTIDEEERKLKRYELIEGDVVITCRGTVNKAAIFPRTSKKVIASANIIVIRLKKEVIPGYLKIFLESPVGARLVKSFQRGSTIMNINPGDIGEMEVPVPDLQLQNQIAQEYMNNFSIYKETIKAATENWTKVRNSLYDKLLD
ncbi:MAG: hypothetical protein HPY66_1946 [Firmicutes bacterium]|nr:hypothetical protein [Bacillota bacterium]